MAKNQTANKNETFNLEDQPDFECRSKITKSSVVSSESSKSFVTKMALDNGQLCPPTNCPTH
jgi:hypothetical protein